jgi:hypothetical protein
MFLTLCFSKYYGCFSDTPLLIVPYIVLERCTFVALLLMMHPVFFVIGFLEWKTFRLSNCSNMTIIYLQELYYYIFILFQALQDTTTTDSLQHQTFCAVLPTPQNKMYHKLHEKCTKDKKIVPYPKFFFRMLRFA